MLRPDCFLAHRALLQSLGMPSPFGGIGNAAWSTTLNTTGLNQLCDLDGLYSLHPRYCSVVLDIDSTPASGLR